MSVKDVDERIGKIQKHTKGINNSANKHDLMRVFGILFLPINKKNTYFFQVLIWHLQNQLWARPQRKSLYVSKVPHHTRLCSPNKTVNTRH
jgi:hypothetical protein